MKPFLFSLFFVAALAGLAQAKPLVAEAPVNGSNDPVTILISNVSWTKVPTSQSFGRVGIFLDNPSTNLAPIVGHYGNCTSTSVPTTVRPIEINPPNNASFFPLSQKQCLWLLSLHSSAENSHYQEVKQ